MIKAEEIMIGDWVFDKDKNTYRQVETKDFYYGITLYFEPIPITPEILEKNGFKPIYHDDKSAHRWNEYDEDDNIQSIIIDFRVKHISEVWSDRTRKSYKGEIVYVHELQQIIKICGISQTIEL